jgi:hypothetical protein
LKAVAIGKHGRVAAPKLPDGLLPVLVRRLSMQFFIPHINFVALLSLEFRMWLSLKFSSFLRP